MKTITLDELQAMVGQESGLSPWRDGHADDDRPVRRRHRRPSVHPLRSRARRAETPFGGTIAHGFLTLSLLSTFAFETAPKLEGADIGINHGFDTRAFRGAGQDRGAHPGAVQAGRRSRSGRPAGCRSTNDVTIEIEDSAKPALTARWLTLTFVPPKAGVVDQIRRDVRAADQHHRRIRNAGRTRGGIHVTDEGPCAPHAARRSPAACVSKC